MAHTSNVKNLIAVPACVLVLITGLSCSWDTGSNAVNSGVATPTSTVTPTPVRASVTTVSLVADDPRKQYYVIKETFAKGFADAPLPELPNDGGAYDLEDCFSGMDELDLDDGDPMIPLVDLAREVARLGFIIPKLGYPESSWGPVLATYETRQLELSIREMGKKFDPQGRIPIEESRDRFKNDLSTTLAEYRAEMDPDLPKLTYEGGCGAGEITIYVKTDPPNGRVRMMPVFFYELCIAQRLDPEDATVCTKWKDAVEGLGLEVAGEYYYRVTWPENVQQKGRISFERYRDEETITFRKQ